MRGKGLATLAAFLVQCHMPTLSTVVTVVDVLGNNGVAGLARSAAR